jgi:hypothetical protein
VSVDRLTATPTSYSVARSTSQQNSPARRGSANQPQNHAENDVQKAMRALREMPPFAREREIDSGRYSHFSQEDKELLRTGN